MSTKKKSQRLATETEFTETLIELVRKRPYLWDMSTNDNKDHVKTSNAWVFIAEHFKLNDSEFQPWSLFTCPKSRLIKPFTYGNKVIPV